MVGFERLYKDGRMAIVHGCGYDHPSLSHFSSMSYWHTGVPNAGEPLGWLGRLADGHLTPATRNLIVNIGTSQSLAVRSGKHSPLVFDDPARFRRDGTDDEKRALGERLGRRDVDRRTRRSTSSRPRPATPPTARTSSARRRRPTGRRSTTASATRFGGGLQRVAALIAAGMKTRLYYVTYQGNAFDTHVQQGDVHSRLLMYTADAVRAFMDDLARIGRADEVAVLMFTEFGRRVEENGSLGTDHGTATPMFLFGKHGTSKAASTAGRRA